MFKIIIPLMIYFLSFNFWNSMIMMILYFMIYLFLFPMFYNISFNNLIYFDNLSFLLIILTIWISFLMILAMGKFYINYNNMNLVIFMVYILMFFLLITFSVNSFLYFYIFFEMSLIPTIYLIMGWGYQPERIKAGLYLLFYTLLASLPLLMGLFFLNFEVKTFSMSLINYKCMNIMLYLSLMVAFLVKMPMFFVHLWLPKAHVEAPISGSMILAAILLKLGGYGLLRVMIILVNFKIMNLFWMMLSMYGGILISLNCLRQLDLKILIAYSSVAHMGLVLGGMMTYSLWGLEGSYLMMIAHGLCSSGLFCLANISYERIHSRSMMINKGLMNFMPSMALWWFLLSSSNMSAPISLNLISEINLINSLVFYAQWNMLLLFFLCFFSASYCFYLFAYSQHGIYFSGLYSYSNNNMREYLLLMFHWFPLNILFLKVFIM